MSEDVPSEDLLIRVARRDVTALGEIYDRYAPRVYGVIAHIVPSRDGADQILQEVFERLWNESSSLSRERRSVAAWLIVTARAAAVQHLRELRRNAGAQDLINEQGPARATRTGKIKSPSPQRAAGVKDAANGATIASLPSAWLPEPKEITLIDGRMSLLQKAVNQLPKPQREAVEMAVFKGFSESEIAVEMGEPLAKVQRSLRAAVAYVKHRRRAVCGRWAANI